MSLADIKEKARRAIHGKLAVPVSYVDADHPLGLVFAGDYEGDGLKVRYHNRLTKTGDLNGDYADIIDGIDKLVFLTENVAEVSAALVANGEAPLVIGRGGVVTIAAYQGLQFTLDTEEPPDGPLEIIWVVARSSG